MPTAGPNSPGTIVSDSAGPGPAVWSNPSNAASSNDSYATATAPSSATKYLKATGFGFAIPAGSTIDGFYIEVERKKASGGTFSNGSLYIVKNGSVVGTSSSDSGFGWSTTDSIHSGGGTASLWDTTWTVSDINSSNFGCAYHAQADMDVFVDHVQITVYYTLPGNDKFFRFF